MKERIHRARSRARWILSAMADADSLRWRRAESRRRPAPPWKVIDASTLRAMMASDKGLPVFNTMSEIECLDHRIPGSRASPARRSRTTPRFFRPTRTGSSSSTARARDATGAAGPPMRPSRPATSRFMSWKAGCPPGSRRAIPWRRIERIPRGSIQSVRA